MLVSEWIILVIASGLIAWFLGLKQGTAKSTANSRLLPQDYFVGLNYLLDEQPDKAVDVFIRLLEVDSDTVETHLALGSLFRRRGEVERAIRIHQNLIARPHLEKYQRIQALEELGQDYMRAGLLDRAERLFQEVVETGERTLSSLRCLLDIYQQEKEWEKAVAIVKQIERLSGEAQGYIAAHHYCALAESHLIKNNIEFAQQELKRAFSHHRHSIRAHLLQGELAMKSSDYKIAITTYKRALEQEPDYVSEIIQPMGFCYRQQNLLTEYEAYLLELLNKTPRISVALALADLIQQREGAEQSAEFMAVQLRLRPSLRGLRRLIELQLGFAIPQKAKENLMSLQEIILQLLIDKPVYRCQHCGFSSKALLWQCPGCKYWDTVRPIYGLEGE